jgi:hypothetical protein
MLLRTTSNIQPFIIIIIFLYFFQMFFLEQGSLKTSK